MGVRRCWSPSCACLVCPPLAASDIPLLLSGAAGVMIVAFAEGLGAAKTYAQKHGYRIDANRELLGLGSANHRIRAAVRNDRQWQPVQDRGQRWSRRQVTGFRVCRRPSDGRDAAVPYRPVRAVARYRVGSRGNCGGDRTCGFRRATAAAPEHDRTPSVDLRPGGAGGLHRSPWRPARCAATTCGRWCWTPRRSR